MSLHPIKANRLRRALRWQWFCACLVAALCLAAEPGAAGDCRRLSVAAKICAGSGLRFSGADPVPETGARLIDMRLDTAAHGIVTLTFIAHDAEQPLGNLAAFKAGYLDQMETKGAILAERYDFRHRRAPSVAQQFTAIHPGPGAGQFWGVTIGLELSDGLVMVLVTSDEPADATTRASWTQPVLDAIYPDTPR